MNRDFIKGEDTPTVAVNFRIESVFQILLNGSSIDG